MPDEKRRASLADLFAQKEQMFNLPSGYLSRTAQIESNMNPNAANPRSSARGLFQFINSTAQQYGLQNPMDPVASTQAAARLARDNADILSRRLGRAPNAAELYLAHQQGAGRAAQYLMNPQVRAVDLAGRDAIVLNGGNINMTAGDFASKWLNKFNGQTGGQMQAAIPAQAMAQAGTAQPVAPMAQAPMENPMASAPPPALSALAQMFQMQQAGEQARRQRQQEEEDLQARRRALFSDPFMFG